MATLEQLTPGTSLRGVLPDVQVTVVSTRWFGSEALELTYKRGDGTVGNVLVYRSDEPRLDVVTTGRPWSFDGDGALFRLVSEAQRIHYAHLFDPLLAVHTSQVDPLPHQITAVYEAMLPRQPLRFLLADDPGAGKTIMAGLLMKELIARGDLKRCLVVCPGSLAEQWQDELRDKFQLPFEILTNDNLEASRTGNWFLENDLAIARLDKLSRNPEVQQLLQVPECGWDLIVCDEAHKMPPAAAGEAIAIVQAAADEAVFLELTRTPKMQELMRARRRRLADEESRAVRDQALAHGAVRTSAKPVQTPPVPPRTTYGSFNREQLYEQVWQEPSRDVAKRYGMSDAMVAKACRVLRVPKPPRGYWNKKAAGLAVPSRPPLP